MCAAGDEIVVWDQHGGSRAQAHQFPTWLVGRRSLRELVPPYDAKKAEVSAGYVRRDATHQTVIAA